ncbi:MAG: hypothetical protein NTU44_08545 [Bacteroidetes bacterium]|nr:hypothetical protein [Bacteroidota bacterium]
MKSSHCFGLGIFIIMLFPITVSFAQIFNKGVFHVKPNEDVYIQGDFTNMTGGRLTLLGTIHLDGNWTNNESTSNIMNNATNGLLRLEGTSQQVMSGISSTKFTNVELANAAGVSLGIDEEVRQVFTFTAGKVFTNTSYLIISDNSLGSLVGYDVNKYVVGNLRRYMTGTSQYDLPVGTTANYELAQLKFASISGMNYVNAFFVAGAQGAPPQHPASGTIYVFPDVMNPVSNPLANPMAKYSYISSFLNAGYWSITPNAGYSSPVFKLTLTERGQTNGGTVAGQHAVIKRIDSGNPWVAQGIYPFNSQSGTGSNPITVYMDQMNTFHDFIIGKSTDSWGPLAIELIAFDAECLDGRVKISWTTSNEENNDHFTVEKSPDLMNWTEVGRIPGQLRSSGNISYDLFDDFPNTGITYYRLKQTDVDGMVNIFRDQWIRYTNCTEGSDTWVKITMGSHYIVNAAFVANAVLPFTLRIFDPLGRLVKEEKGMTNLGYSSASLSLQGNPDGLYMIEFRAGNMHRNQKILINR